jgi:hypothetical protein
MNIDSGDTPLVLLCPAWKTCGTPTTVKPGTAILHSRADEIVPFADSEELVTNSGLRSSVLVQVGSDHRLADPEPLAAMLRAVEQCMKTDYDCADCGHTFTDDRWHCVEAYFKLNTLNLEKDEAYRALPSGVG